MFKNSRSPAIVVAILTIAIGVRGERKISEEAAVFNACKAGVFTIYGDESKGSGFLISDIGVILTNQHVVDHTSQIRVQLNDSTKVRAKLIAENKHRDIAVLLVNPAVVRGLPTLSLRRDSTEIALEGEKVLAIGNPLNQTRVLTSGIVGKVERDAIISDVNINHGNSGGPLLNLDSQVIAINTFGDFTNQGGPGISGSIRIDLLLAFIDSALAIASHSDFPVSDGLPTMPREMFPLSELEKIASVTKWDDKPYHLKADNFIISIMTPTYFHWQASSYRKLPHFRYS